MREEKAKLSGTFTTYGDRVVFKSDAGYVAEFIRTNDKELNRFLGILELILLAQEDDTYEEKVANGEA